MDQFSGAGHSADGQSHINGIVNFWSIAKTIMAKFRGIYKSTFLLHLNESEFGFNYRQENLYENLLKMVRDKPLKLS